MQYRAGRGTDPNSGMHTFFTSTPSGYAERMKIENNGNVNINGKLCIGNTCIDESILQKIKNM
jgi:hypothetical protein